jgi:uncharacterized protein YjbJ (UPF0337 family)
MYKYRINIKKVSGRLNESVLPSKNLVVKSKSKKSDNQVFAEASKFFKKKYGLVIESADVIFEGFFDKVGGAIKNVANKAKNKVSNMFNRGNKQQVINKQNDEQTTHSTTAS